MSAAGEGAAKKPEVLSAEASATDAGNQEKGAAATAPATKGTKRLQEDADDDDAFNNTAAASGTAGSVTAKFGAEEGKQDGQADASAGDADANRPNKRAKRDAASARGGRGARLGGGRSRGGRGGAKSDRSFGNESSADGVTTAGEDKTAETAEGQEADEGKGREAWQHRDRRKDLNKGGNFNTDRAKLWKEGDGAADGEEEDDGPRLPKRRVCVYFGYCGIGYSGLQINPGVKTIEGDIFDSFCALGAVSQDNAVNPTKVGLQRAARTDRGVHAAGNLMSLKLILEPQGVANQDELISKINEKLPEYIRIWGITRVQNSFDARQSCDSRMYEYLLPTYVFLPPKPGTAMYDMLKKMKESGSGSSSEEGAADADSSKPLQSNSGEEVPSWDAVLNHPFWEKQGTRKTFTEDLIEKKKWRMPTDMLSRVRKIFDQFSGSHNFHNFTVQKEFRDRSAHRFMKNISISDPMMIGETEWISVKLHGQSFMLHQIRKMIGLLVLVGRTNAPSSLIPETFGPARVHVPKAPGLGLLLENPVFETYNKRIIQSNRAVENKKKRLDPGEQNKQNLDGQVRDSVEYTAFRDDMQAFKQKFIYDRIFKTEEETTEFGKWLNYLDVFTGPDFEYLNPKGVIPTSCMLKLGEWKRDDGPKEDGEKGEDDEDDEDLLKRNKAEELEG